MADDADFAQEAQATHIEIALAARKRPEGGDSRRTCANCHDPIPEKRRKALPGVRFCVDCQEEFERR